MATKIEAPIDPLAEALAADAALVEAPDFPEDFDAALAAEEARIPVDPQELMRKEQLGEVVGEITDDDGNTISSAMRRVKDSPEWESYVTLYSTFDGMPSRVLRGMAPKKLRQRWPEVGSVPEALWGKPVFTRRPLKKYVEGTQKCMLNPDHPMRDFVIKAGLGHLVCNKSNLPTEFAVRQHMQHKHHDEWAALEAARVEAEAASYKDKQEENNALLRALLQELTASRRAEASE